MTLPHIPTTNAQGQVVHYAVYDTVAKRVITGIFNGSDITTDKAVAKSRASSINLAYKPQYRNHTVITIVFDPEV